jgi:hypothetical protein
MSKSPDVDKTAGQARRAADSTPRPDTAPPSDKAKPPNAAKSSPAAKAERGDRKPSESSSALDPSRPTREKEK